MVFLSCDVRNVTDVWMGWSTFYGRQ
uniref:Uncharacterized protein n=1 Tax=Anguilla anguilla TaxID=7936 RepID=A0A0E9QTD5_ANGAN